MERSTLTPPSFLPESEDAKKWVWCQSPGLEGASQEAARRVSLSKDFMPAADGYSGNPVRILGSASTGHLHFDTKPDPVPNSTLASLKDLSLSLSLSLVFLT